MRENGGEDPKIIEFNKPGKKERIDDKKLSEAKINAADIFSQAQDLEQKGQNSEAIELYNTAFILDPEHWQSGVNLGAIYIKQKEYQKAITILRKVYEVRPEESLLYYDLAIAYEGLKDLAQAAENYEKALYYNPSDVNIIYNYADVLFRQRNISKALEYYKKYKALTTQKDEFYELVSERIEKLTGLVIKKSGIKPVKKKPKA